MSPGLTKTLHADTRDGGPILEGAAGGHRCKQPAGGGAAAEGVQGRRRGAGSLGAQLCGDRDGEGPGERAVLAAAAVLPPQGAAPHHPPSCARRRSRQPPAHPKQGTRPLICLSWIMPSSRSAGTTRCGETVTWHSSMPRLCIIFSFPRNSLEPSYVLPCLWMRSASAAFSGGQCQEALHAVLTVCCYFARIEERQQG